MTRLLIPVLLAGALTNAFGLDYLPIAAGNNWTLRDAQSGSEITVSVGPDQLRAGQTWNLLTGYTSNPVLVRMGPSGDILYLNESSGREQLLVSFNLTGMWWTDAGNANCTLEGAPVGGGDHEGPTGRVRTVLQLRYRRFGCADLREIHEQFAPNLGLMRRIVHSWAGTRRYELVRARVGGLAIDPLAAGRFTTSVSRVENSDEIDVTLRLQTGSAVALKLDFPSSQEYDIAIRDAAGRRLWTWSADKLFAMAEHTVTVSGEWVKTVRVPAPAGLLPSGGLVVAWLTTKPDAPRLGATAAIDAQR
ncbi:MAG TPA: BsuPI-related putative proteinase inhibitor [Bryobacteraceae bacterium]|nr:BsuPI-related putative proteinase inhibitor [Bryobacteraceae bacterium]